MAHCSERGRLLESCICYCDTCQRRLRPFSHKVLNYFAFACSWSKFSSLAYASSLWSRQQESDDTGPAPLEMSSWSHFLGDGFCRVCEDFAWTTTFFRCYVSISWWVLGSLLGSILGLVGRRHAARLARYVSIEIGRSRSRAVGVYVACGLQDSSPFIKLLCTVRRWSVLVQEPFSMLLQQLEPVAKANFC